MANRRVPTNKKTTAHTPLRRKKARVSKKRFRNASGKYAQLTVLDANSATFGTDLLNVFRANVAKARRENKRLFGSLDGVGADK
jgi:hypothetical protein